VEGTRAEAIQAGYRLTTTLVQTQAGPAYRLEVPIAIHLAGADRADQRKLSMTKKVQKFEIAVSARPLRLDIDPEFDLFRRLDPQEIPPALSLAFGSKRPLFLLPAKEKHKTATGYRKLAETWRQFQNPEIEIVWDDEIEMLPSDRTVWLLGWENRFLKKMAEALRNDDTVFGDGQVQVGHDALHRKEQAVVMVTRHPDNPDLALAWLATDNLTALPGLARKLPHYGRYGFLGFKGDAPENMLKGEWPITQSPLSVPLPVDVVQSDGIVEPHIGKLAERKALAALPSASP